MLLRLLTVGLSAAVVSFATVALASGISPNVRVSGPRTVSVPNRDIAPKVSPSSGSWPQLRLNDEIKGPPPCDWCKK